VALWAMGVQIPPPTRHLPCGTQEAPEAIIGLRGFRSPEFPRQPSEITLPTISAASDAALSSGCPYTSAVMAMLACPS
jgi:hypothetical protein